MNEFDWSYNYTDFGTYTQASEFAQSKTQRVIIRFNPTSGRYDCYWEKAA